MLRRLLRIIVVTLLFVAATPLAASADDSDFEAKLSPRQEVQTPAVVSDGDGEAEFTVKRSKVRFELEWDDLTTPAMAAHIHCGVKGVNGPVGVTLLSVAMGEDGKVKGSFTAPDAGNTCGWTSLGDVLAAMIGGGAYVNVHTATYPAGEIRGQIKPEDIEFEAKLSPRQEVQTPAVVSDGDGEAEFTVKRSKVRFELEWDDLTTPAMAAHIHCGVKGVNGPVGVTLLSVAMGEDGKVKGSFTAPDAGNTCGWTSLGDVLAAMIGGGAYVNVHTATYPAGEIRGQIKID